MVKYGKEFRKNQKSDWKEKYFNYKAQKQLIKKQIEQRKEIELIGDIDLDEKIKHLAFVFEEGLNKEMKRVFIFFANKEKTLYKNINKSLHYKNEYEEFGLNDFKLQYEELRQLSELSLDMSNFVFYNLKALIKILKKYDKKVITYKKKDLLIKQNYIQEKIEEQNSDILYLLKFKMIDEVNVILEDLINNLMKQFKSDKDRLIEDEQKDEEGEEGEERLIKDDKSINETINSIKQNHEQIKQNIQKIDAISGLCTKLFLPWKSFLRISGDINSKFIQISKESSINDSGSSGFLRNQSIIDSIVISRDSKYNIFIVLFHGFLYMFSFSVIIPSYISIIGKSTENNDSYKHIFWGILMAVAPIGILFNYLYETCLFKRSTKKPIIFSCIGLIVGNLLYVFAPYFKVVYLLFIGRFICGLFNLRTHNKMYIINFLLKKDVSHYLTMFHTASIFGLALGFGLNSAFYFITIDNDIFNRYTIGSIITCFLSFILLLITCITFTEAHSKKFSITSMQMFGEGIAEESMSEGPDDGDNYARNVRHKTLVLKDIDDKLGDFNRASNFDDTNLVTKSINELASKEEVGLHSLFNVYVIYLLIIITTKFINESLFINSNIFILINENEDKSKYEIIIPLVLGCSYFMILLVELSLSCKSWFITERTLIIILLFLLLINNGLFFLFFGLEKSNYYYIIPTDIIIANITEKYAAHLFLYIIPDSYKICSINGNVFINIFSMISRIVCCAMLIIIIKIGLKAYNLIIFAFMTGLSLISLLLYLIYYKEIRIKAIKRIMKNIPKDDIKIATEL